jgi:hypothetical protein
MGILRSSDATTGTVNFTRHVKRSLVAVAQPINVVIVVCPRENVGYKVVVPRKVIFLHHLKQLQLTRREF